MKPGEISQGFGPAFLEPGAGPVESVEETTPAPGPAASGPALTTRKETAITTPTKDPLTNVSDDDLLREAGVDLSAPVPVSQTCTTSEAAEYFDRTTQWLYYMLGTGRLVDERGRRLKPRRVGKAGGTGERVFDMDLLTEILKANYRLGNVEPEELKRVLRRIKMTRQGIEWRAHEGWKRVRLRRHRYRWVPPEKAMKVDGEWTLRPEYRPPSRSKKKDEENS